MGDENYFTFFNKEIIRRLEEMLREQSEKERERAEFEEVFTDLDKLTESIRSTGGEWPRHRQPQLRRSYSYSDESNYYSNIGRNVRSSYYSAPVYYYDLESSNILHSSWVNNV